MKMVLQNIVSFIVLVLVQVLVLNNIHFMGYINPYIYILFILLLPVRFSRHFTLILAFVLGLIIDAFSNTYGVRIFNCSDCFPATFAVNLFANIEEDTNPTPPSTALEYLPFQICDFFSLYPSCKFFPIKVFSFIIWSYIVEDCALTP